MKSYLLTSGKNALTAQNGSSTLLQFGSFVVGDSVSFTYDASRTTVYGNTVFTGTIDDIRYSQHSDDGVLLKLYIDQAETEKLIGNVVLYLSDGTAFALFYTSGTFLKTTTTDNSVGTRWELQIYINIPQLNERISLDNLTSDYATFQQYENQKTMTFPHYELYDQAVIKDHTVINRLVPLINTFNIWTGYPFAMNMQDTNFKLSLDGGEVGDNYTYTSVSE